MQYYKVPNLTTEPQPERVMITKAEFEAMTDALAVTAINLKEALDCDGFMCGHCIEILAPLYDMIEEVVGEVEV